MKLASALRLLSEAMSNLERRPAPPAGAASRPASVASSLRRRGEAGDGMGGVVGVTVAAAGGMAAAWGSARRGRARDARDAQRGRQRGRGPAPGGPRARRRLTPPRAPPRRARARGSARSPAAPSPGLQRAGRRQAAGGQSASAQSPPHQRPCGSARSPVLRRTRGQGRAGAAAGRRLACSALQPGTRPTLAVAQAAHPRCAAPPPWRASP